MGCNLFVPAADMKETGHSAQASVRLQQETNIIAPTHKGVGSSAVREVSLCAASGECKAVKADELSEGLESYWHLSAKGQQHQAVSLNDAGNEGTSLRISHNVKARAESERSKPSVPVSTAAMHRAAHGEVSDEGATADQRRMISRSQPINLSRDKEKESAGPVSHHPVEDLLVARHPTTIPASLANLAKRRAAVAAARQAASSADRQL
jgi:hypothetical protein